MPEKNKAILEAANTAIAEGNNEGFLSFCADDTHWTFVGDKTLNGTFVSFFLACALWVLSKKIWNN